MQCLTFLGLQPVRAWRLAAHRARSSCWSELAHAACRVLACRQSVQPFNSRRAQACQMQPACCAKHCTVHAQLPMKAASMPLQDLETILICTQVSPRTCPRAPMTAGRLTQAKHCTVCIQLPMQGKTKDLTDYATLIR